MAASALGLLARALAALPLPLSHALGGGLGVLVYYASPRYARRLRENLAQAGHAGLLRPARREAGKGLLELPAVWLRPQAAVERLFPEVRGWPAVEEALRRGRGAVLLTPHSGCFEAAARFITARVPLTILYRPPKLAALAPLLARGRAQGLARLAAADAGGVRALFKALRRGEAVGLLPDQVPGRGEGVWAEFFGRPAYTMTLAVRLVERTGAPAFLVLARRLAAGRGYALSFEAFELPTAANPEGTARAVNAAVEALIARAPAQYLWGYNRYKRPAGAPPPPHSPPPRKTEDPAAGSNRPCPAGRPPGKNGA